MNAKTPMSLMDFVNAAKTRIKEIDPDQLQRMVESDKDLLLIDVREASEHEQGHIAGDILVPRGILEAAADPTYAKCHEVLCVARDRRVVLYCATGGRSALAADALQMMGFKDVASLEGGMVRWVQEAKPVAKEARSV
jgi:rhodanese-related sulfurtransferase